MAKKKRTRKKHLCVNHPKVIARGRCSLCGKWFCRSCLTLKNGKFYCSSGCDTASENSTEKIFTSLPATTRKKNSSKIIFLVMLTLIFSLSAVNIIDKIRISTQKNKIIELSKLNDKYKQTLIDRNRYIRKLKDGQAVKLYNRETTSITKSNVAPEIKRYNYYSSLPLTFDNGKTDKKLIALTFDAGAHANYYKMILDTLYSRGVKATVFMTGRFIINNPGIVKEIVASGHVIGNHTFSHPHLTTWAQNSQHITLSRLNKDILTNELNKTNSFFKKLTGRDMYPIWRAPYGEKNREIESWGQKAGYIHIGWRQARHWVNNYDTNDWVPDSLTPGFHTPLEVYEKFDRLSDLKPYGMNGAIILMHMGTVRKSNDMQVHRYLGKIIDMLSSKGYQFFTIPQMLKESGIDVSKLRERL